MENTSALESRRSPGLFLGALWTRARAVLAGVHIRPRQRRLRLCESISLGEKRLIAVVQFDERRFLIAATPQTISLLQPLGAAPAEEERNTLLS